MENDTFSNDIVNRIELIEKDLQNNKTKLKESKRKNFISKNASIFISILALLVSIIFNITGLQRDSNSKKAASRKEKIDNIHALINDLVENDQKYAKDISNPTLIQNGFQFSYTYSYTRDHYLDKISN